MKNYSKIYLSILIGLLVSVVFSCKKDTDNVPNQKENPDFDPQFAIESKVSINANEIGGTNLFLVSAQDEKSVLSKGEFNTVVSKIGEQFLVVKDENDKVRALTLSTPNSNSTNIMNVNATSTATTLIFLSPGILTLDQEGAATIIQKIQNLNSYSEFELFLKNNLSSKSLDEIVKDVKYDQLLSNCITEYANSNKTKSATPISEAKNSFKFTFAGGNSINLQNNGFRFVNIVQRDLDFGNNELILKTVFTEMHGAVPFSWGSFFTKTSFNPTIENINFSPVNKTFTSEFWIIGPGNFLNNDIVPDNISKIEQPWAETIVYYAIFPLLDCWAGAKTFTNTASPLFKELMTTIKASKSTILLTKAKDIPSFNRALIDFTVSALGVIATSAATSAIVATGSIPAKIVGTVLTLTSGVFGAANFTDFTVNMLLIDPYSKFVVQQELEKGTVTDIDGNVYKTVKIGDQWWMAENLRTTKYNDGISIPNVTNVTSWAALTTGAYCWYDNDISYKNPYGALYNWYAVNTRKLAPIGWHVASDAEWTTLTDYLGGESVAGGKLKESGYIHWLSPNIGATNESGFSALPAGRRSNQGSFVDIGSSGKWWSSTESSTSSAVTRNMYNNYGDVLRSDYLYFKGSGFSVRCIKGEITANIVVPTIATNDITEITQTSATSGGNITSDGGAAVTARGVCWSTTQNPTTANSKTTNGTGAGIYTSNLTGLSANANYYVRAYATNSVGTAYGNQVSFKTSAASVPGTVTDIDGNVYHTITIGTQVWMVENLKTTRCNDGSAIFLETDRYKWPFLYKPGYCWYNNDAVSNKNTYGALYNWYSVNTGKLAPVGWHVPSDYEWATLINYLGGESYAGGKLKESGLAHWSITNTGATNETGFTALPGGNRTTTSSYYGIGTTGFWWSSTEIPNSGLSAYAWIMYDYSANAKRNINYMFSDGLSVRCIKD